jgi:hypothetical protein
LTIPQIAKHNFYKLIKAAAEGAMASVLIATAMFVRGNIPFAASGFMEWTNKKAFLHTVGPGCGVINAGRTYPYHCNIHPFMTEGEGRSRVA